MHTERIPFASRFELMRNDSVTSLDTYSWYSSTGPRWGLLFQLLGLTGSGGGRVQGEGESHGLGAGTWEDVARSHRLRNIPP